MEVPRVQGRSSLVQAVHRSHSTPQKMPRKIAVMTSQYPLLLLLHCQTLPTISLLDMLFPRPPLQSIHYPCLLCHRAPSCKQLLLHSAVTEPQNADLNLCQSMMLHSLHWARVPWSHHLLIEASVLGIPATRQSLEVVWIRRVLLFMRSTHPSGT